MAAWVAAPQRLAALDPSAACARWTAKLSAPSALLRHDFCLQQAAKSARWQACHASSSSSASGSRPAFEPDPADRADTDGLLSLLRHRGPSAARQGPGDVFLVGTGPGDPGLLTMRAVQLMQSADVVLYDRLVSDDILRLVHAGARMVYVGKRAGFHTRTQAEIHELLCAFASEGATVLRLKGGDPFIFGRGGEEAQYLAARGIRCHCVPGITAASGIAAELGIPLTHRGVATSVRFLTGHAREGGQAALDATIPACADAGTTLVVYMGLATLPLLVGQLTAAGLDPATPAAAVERGCTPEQRAVWARLDELPGRVEAAALASPTLVVVGAVVALAPGWAAAQGGQECADGMAGWAQAASQQGSALAAA